MTQLHYLSCQDENCEKFACVARRDYETKIQNLTYKNRVLQKEIEKQIDRKTRDSDSLTDMELKIVKNNRDELLEEVKRLKNILGKK